MKNVLRRLLLSQPMFTTPAQYGRAQALAFGLGTAFAALIVGLLVWPFGIASYALSCLPVAVAAVVAQRRLRPREAAPTVVILTTVDDVLGNVTKIPTLYAAEVWVAVEAVRYVLPTGLGTAAIDKLRDKLTTELHGRRESWDEVTFTVEQTLGKKGKTVITFHVIHLHDGYHYA